MERLIYRDEALLLITDLPVNSTDAETLQRCIEVISNMPIVDAVPVVRCRDCKHRDPEDKKCDCGHDIRWQLQRDDDWYCADGERKDGEQDG